MTRRPLWISHGAFRKKGHRPSVPELSFQRFERLRRVVRDDVNEILSLMGDCQSPRVERRIAYEKVRFEMLHARCMDVSGRDVEPEPITK
jgi:hypothetical protein